MRILLVDDEQEFVTTLAERLSFRGIEADWATNAEDALKHAEKTSYDLAVLDVKMPKTSGFELKNLLENKRPGMKYIYLTGHGSFDDFVAGSSEAACYLVKPININDLILKMQEALEN
jgi:DNA-binding response OmpR family regulator